ncbi:MAG: hypothetical protein V2A73_08815 [Pseudomonadota bacterium]
MDYEGFSSWPEGEEKTFVVFEQRMVEATKKANLVGGGVSLGLLVVTLAIVLGFWAPLKPMGGEGGEPAAAQSAPQH